MAAEPALHDLHVDVDLAQTLRALADNGLAPWTADGPALRAGDGCEVEQVRDGRGKLGEVVLRRAQLPALAVGVERCIGSGRPRALSDRRQDRGATLTQLGEADRMLEQERAFEIQPPPG